MNNLNLIHIILSADLISKLIFAVLIFMSVYCTWSIIRNILYFRFLSSLSKNFIYEVWNTSMNINDTFVASQRYNCCEAAIVKAGINTIKQHNQSPSTMQNYVSLSMHSKLNQEIDILESKVYNLVLLSYISPFIGLFGTVWGVIVAFGSLGKDAANMSMVFTGMAEALTATMLGLFIAIPSYCAYHFFSGKINEIQLRLESLVTEFKIRNMNF